MRVVAGELRGRRLVSPPSGVTRPTTDKVREAMFNALGSLDVVDGAHAVDLFAGTGAVGIEALSRGAAHVTFVEHHRLALRALRDNIDTLGIDDRVTVIDADARTATLPRLSHQIRWPSNGFDDLNGGGRVVFADPPYDFDGWDDLFGALAAWRPVPLVVTESGREVTPPAPWAVLRSKRYGRTWVAFCEVPAQ